MSKVLELAKTLIARESVTPQDAGCQTLMGDMLQQLGFENESLHFVDTLNLWSVRGQQGPIFCFAGHTDVVPTGPLHEWDTPPFEPVVKDGMLYGRGAADMKGSLAAMMTATERFVQQHPDHKGRIAFLITSDEEGPFINGTTRVVDTLLERGEHIDYCVVGEPSSTARLGDVVKNGRRGSLTGDLTLFGIQGHVAYPHLVKNPIHMAGPVISELSQTEWDQGNAFFPPTSFQVSNVNGGTGAGNVVPGSVNIQFNFRYSTETDHHSLKSRVEALLKAHGLEYELHWTLNGEPFLTSSGELIDATVEAIEECMGYTPSLETSGGTSDGRFIAKMGGQLLELGPINKTIHKINECVPVEQLQQLEEVYYQLMRKMLL